MTHKDWSKWQKKRITLSELEHFWDVWEYGALVEMVQKTVRNGELAPVKKSLTSGRVPSLAQSYWVRAKQEMAEELLEELHFKLHPALDNSYYLAHLEHYSQERAAVLAFNRFWYDNQAALQTKMSLHERSFQIWQREKFLQSESGRQILRKVGLTLEALNVYQTMEQLAYYTKKPNG